VGLYTQLATTRASFKLVTQNDAHLTYTYHGFRHLQLVPRVSTLFYGFLWYGRNKLNIGPYSSSSLLSFIAYLRPLRGSSVTALAYEKMSVNFVYFCSSLGITLSTVYSSI
jgi:hypothetical protein